MPAKKVMPASTSVDESIAVQPRQKPLQPPKSAMFAQVEAMVAAAGRSRHAVRDEALILVCYRHGLRVAELIALEWVHVDFPASLLTVRWSKRGLDGTHPLTGRDLRMLRVLQRKARTAYGRLNGLSVGAPEGGASAFANSSWPVLIDTITFCWLQ